MVEWVEDKFSTKGEAVKIKGIKYLLVAVICILIIASCITIKIPEKKERLVHYPAKRHGANILVEKRDARLIKGELVTVKDSSLLMLESKSAKEVFIDTKEVKSIKIIKKSSFLIGLGTGFAIGATHGALMPGALAGRLTFALMLGFPGAVLGGFTGAILGIKKFEIEDMSPEEIKETLGKLRSKARVHDYYLYIWQKIRENKHKEIEKDVTEKKVDIFSKDGYYLYKTTLPKHTHVIKNGYLYAREVEDDELVKRYKIKNWNQIKEGI
jgi:hypothetical protein